MNPYDATYKQRIISLQNEIGWLIDKLEEGVPIDEIDPLYLLPFVNEHNKEIVRYNNLIKTISIL